MFALQGTLWSGREDTKMFNEESTVISDVQLKERWKHCEDRSKCDEQEPRGLWGHLGKRKWGP